MYLLPRREVDNQRELLRGVDAISAGFCYFVRYAIGEWLCSFGLEPVYVQVTIVKNRCSSLRVNYLLCL
jgi:hypothetical protein